MRTFLRAPALSLASQCIGLVQLALLLWRVGANEATDAFFYLFNIGMLPVQVVVVGVMYPLILNSEKLTKTGIARVRWSTPILAVFLMLIGSGYLYLNGRLSPELWPIAVAALLNAFVQARLWFRGVTAEAGGEPRWNAAIALPANGLAVLSLLIPFGSPATSVTAMVFALIVGNVAMLYAATRRRIGESVIAAAPEFSRGNAGAYWFFTKSSIGYLGLIVLQSLAVLLPASAVTLLNIGVKIVGSIAATFVNAVMPRIIHHQSVSIEPSRRFMRGLSAILAVVSIVGVGIVSAVEPSLLLAAVCVGLWVLASTAAAISQRMSFRFLKPSASKITIIAVPAVVLLALVSTFAPGFQLIVLLCAYAAVDGVTATFLLFALRDRVMSWVLLAVCVSLALIWISALG